MEKAIVLGGGISGLAAARSLRRHGWDVTVLEAAPLPGGSLRTCERDGFRLELGPNTVQQSPDFEELCRDAGCHDELCPASPLARHRFVVRAGRAVALPASPPGILTTPLLSPGAKLRLLGEPFRARGPGAKESVGSFFRRRLGPEVAERLADALVLGIFAGDPDELAVGYALPRLAALEAEHGSLLRGLLKGPRGTTPALVSCRGGLARLAQLLTRDLDVLYSVQVLEVTRQRETLHVALQEGTSTRGLTAHRVVSALPATVASRVLAPLGDTTTFRSLPHASVAVLGLGYRREQVAHPLDGFGLLAPHREDRRILGCLFSSTLFPQTAPQDHVLLTVMMGGRRRPELLDQPDADLLRLAGEELASLLGVEGPPRFSHVHRWKEAIPQPTAQWAEVRDAIHTLEEENAGLTVLGHWCRGVGIRDCTAAGWSVE